MTTSRRNTGLWHNGNFLKLWTGQTISVFGSQVTLLALPLVAVITLKATAVQMGILTAAGTISWLLIGLFAGVWVDRLRRRPILIAADTGRALLLIFVPIAALLRILNIEELYVIAFLVGALTVFFGVAYPSFLPSVVQREQLVEGNSKMEVSRSIAQIAGPGLGGFLVQIFTAPFAIVVDVISFVISAVFLCLIRVPESPPKPVAQRQSMRKEIIEGLHLVLENPLLRAMAFATATFNLFAAVTEAVYILYATRQLGISPSALGLIFAVAGPGALFGAVTAPWFSRRFGVGPTIAGSLFLLGIGSLFVPLAGGSLIAAILILALSQFLLGFALPIYDVNVISLAQGITPERFLGRMNASTRFIYAGVGPIGAFIGGILGGTIGLRPTLLVAALGALFGFLWILLSPTWKVKEQPSQVEDNEFIEEVQHMEQEPLSSKHAQELHDSELQGFAGIEIDKTPD